MRDFLISLSGARSDVLERCPTEQGKFEGIGGSVLTTGVLAVLSMSFALHSALGVTLFVAIPGSAVWGLAILSLDRWLVTTMQADGPRRWRMAVPRVLMAVLLGAVISTPLVLRIFKSEIDAQIVQIKQQRANSFTGRQNSGTIGQEVSRLRTSVADLQKVISAGGDVPLDPAQDPQIKALSAERDGQQTQADSAYAQWQCQLYGGRDCPRKGDGVLAQASEDAYKKAKSRIGAIDRQIDTRKGQLTARDDASKRFRYDAAKGELPKAQAQLDAATKRQSDLQKSFDAENEATNGLLIRLQALNQVSGKDLTLSTAHLLLFLLFMLIECLPVSVKLMQKPGNYERILALVTRQEYRAARDSVVPGLRRRSGDRDPATVREFWTQTAARSGPSAQGAAEATPFTAPAPRPAPRPAPPGGTDTTGIVAGETSLDHGHGSFEDEALREMSGSYEAAPSPWQAGTAARGSVSEESGGIDLFPEDD